MLIILGESGSGKTTLQKYICEHTDMERVISCTTRPIRNGEENGVDYYFMIEEEYDKLSERGFFVEKAEYNSWNYALSIDQIKDNKVAVLTPHGLRMVKKYIKENNLDIKITSIYLKVDKVSRLIKLLKRDGEERIWESIRRTMSDVGQFDGIEDEVDIVIDNSEYRLSVETLFEKLNSVLKERGDSIV